MYFCSYRYMVALIHTSMPPTDIATLIDMVLEEKMKVEEPCVPCTLSGSTSLVFEPVPDPTLVLQTGEDSLYIVRIDCVDNMDSLYENIETIIASKPKMSHLSSCDLAAGHYTLCGYCDHPYLHPSWRLGGGRYVIEWAPWQVDGVGMNIIRIARH